MNTFERSGEFDAWLAALKDKVGRARAIAMARTLDKEEARGHFVIRLVMRSMDFVFISAPS